MVDDQFSPGVATAVTAPVNLGNPDEYTIGELGEQVLDVVGSRSPFIYEPLPQDGPKQRRPDISLAARLATESVCLRGTLL